MTSSSIRKDSPKSSSEHEEGEAEADDKVGDLVPKKTQALPDGGEERAFLPLEDLSSAAISETIPFHQQRPVNLYKKALYHKEKGTEFFKSYSKKPSETTNSTSESSSSAENLRHAANQ